MAKIYNQKTLSAAEQVQALINYGLIINNEPEALRWLSYTSYFRFNNYALFFKEKEDPRLFNDGVTFEQIAELYSFDQKLKLHLFDAIENIEISVKTQICNTMNRAYGAHWYLEKNRFLPHYEHDKLLLLLQDKCDEGEEWFIKHYSKTDFDPKLPPSWMMMEVITFGAVSQIFENLSPCDEKNQICEHFKLPKNLLTSWLHCFTYIRNKCVHHSRIVYKQITISPAMPSKKSRVFLKENDLVDQASLYAVLCAMRFMLITCNCNSGFKGNIISLLDSYPQINLSKLGFTPNWREEDIWK